jgi:hypothetical protein
MIPRATPSAPQARPNNDRPITQVLALRACALCMHSAVYPGASDMTCICPAVIVIHGKAMPAQAARAETGACGPDARHLDRLNWRAHAPTLETAS